MRVEISRLLAPVTVLGAGCRIALWVQGCRLACPGCASVDTWAAGDGIEWDTSALAALIVERVRELDLDGLTLSGGEPLDQAEAVQELVVAVRSGLRDAHWRKEFDVLVFTGYAPSVAKKRAGGLWRQLDAAVCGPYKRSMPGNDPLVASSNQELLFISDLGHKRYPLHHTVPRMQAVSDGDDLLMVGLPRVGELDDVLQRLNERGVLIGSPTWRS